MNNYSFLRHPVRFLLSFITDPDYETDESYKSQKAAADSFVQATLSPESRSLLLDFAKANWSDCLSNFRRLDDKRESFIKFTGGVLVIMSATSRSIQIGNVWYLQSACFAFLVSLIVLLLSRRVVGVPMLASIQSFRETMRDAELWNASKANAGQPVFAEDLAAATFHKSCEALAVVENVMASHINFALIWMLLGMSLLIPALCHLFPDPVPYCQ